MDAAGDNMDVDNDVGCTASAIAGATVSSIIRVPDLSRGIFCFGLGLGLGFALDTAALLPFEFPSLELESGVALALETGCVIRRKPLRVVAHRSIGVLMSYG